MSTFRNALALFVLVAGMTAGPAAWTAEPAKPQAGFGLTRYHPQQIKC